MIKIGICDDEKDACLDVRNVIEKYFSESKQDAVIKIFHNGNELINEPEKFELIFLDVEMGDLNGIDVVKEIRLQDKDVCFVFVTNHTKYWRSAYQVHIFDYIEKPITYEKISRVLNDYMEIKNEKKSSRSITLHTKEKVIVINISDIYYFLIIDRNKLMLKTKENEYYIKERLADISRLLDDDRFYSSHRSCILNFDYVDSIADYDIIMKNKEFLPIAHNRKKEFMTVMNQYVFGKLV